MSEYNLPNGWVSIELGFFMKKGTGSVNPALFTNEEFDLYSIPAYDIRLPEVLSGSQIGSAKKVLQENDVLLSRIVPHIQRSWIVGPYRGRRQIGSGEWIIFDGNGISPSFLRFFLLSYDFHQKFMKTISGVGGSLTRANPNQTAEFKFPLPPLAEQHRIVARIEELFSSLDQGVEALKTAQQQLKVYRQAVLKWAFEGRLTHPDLEEGVLPEGWVERKIEDVAYINPKLPFDNLHDQTIVTFLPMKNVEEVVNRIHLTEERKYMEVKKGFTAMTDGDVIFAKITPCMENGKVAVVNNLKNKIAFGSTEFHVLRCQKELLNTYLFHFLVQERFRQDAERNMTGAVGQRRVPKKYLAEQTIPFPEIRDEQARVVQEIESRLSVCDKIEEYIVQSLERAEALRQSILKQAFEGRLVEQDPDDEPAGVLLERIATARQSKQKAQKPRKSKRSGP